jgi:hypothetical protein
MLRVSGNMNPGAGLPGLRFVIKRNEIDRWVKRA